MTKKKNKERRDNNYGSLYWNKRCKKWIAQMDFGINEKGKRIRKQVYYGDSKEKAYEVLLQAVKQKNC